MLKNNKVGPTIRFPWLEPKACCTSCNPSQLPLPMDVEEMILEGVHHQGGEKKDEKLMPLEEKKRRVYVSDREQGRPPSDEDGLNNRAEFGPNSAQMCTKVVLLSIFAGRCPLGQNSRVSAADCSRCGRLLLCALGYNIINYLLRRGGVSPPHDNLP